MSGFMEYYVDIHDHYNEKKDSLIRSTLSGPVFLPPDLPRKDQALAELVSKKRHTTITPYLVMEPLPTVANSWFSFHKQPHDAIKPVADAKLTPKSGKK